MEAYRLIETLFQGILDQSIQIEGRFHISYKYGAQEINADILSELINETPEKKYPLVLMTPPNARSEYDESRDGEWERFRIILFFVNNSYKQQIDENTKKSQYKIPYDWDDMKGLALDFKAQLNTVQKATLGKIFRIPSNTALIIPVSATGSDRASGVKLDFDMDIYVGCRIITDYQTLQIPVLT